MLLTKRIQCDFCNKIHAIEDVESYVSVTRNNRVGHFCTLCISVTIINKLKLNTDIYVPRVLDGKITTLKDREKMGPYVSPWGHTEFF